MDRENQENEEKKKRFLSLCKKIVKAPKNTLKLLKENPICNLRQIERKAKNVKDPNPLQSMMASVNEKFPISIDRERAKLCDIPAEYLGGSDTHRSGRRLCKLEAVSWYLTSPMEMNEDLKKSIDLLYRSQRSLAEGYFLWDWEHSRVYYGEQQMERRRVQTGKPEADVPRNMRTNHLLAALFPDSIISWNHIDMGILRSIKEIIETRMEAKIPILLQMRLLNSLLDPRERMIPTSPTLPYEVQGFRHSFSSLLHIVKVSPLNPRKRGEPEGLAQTLGAVFAYLVDEGKDIYALAQRVRNCTIEGSTLGMLASRTMAIGALPDLFRTVYNVECPIMSTIMGAEFFPQAGKVETRRTQNQKGVFYFEYVGEEDILVRYEKRVFSFYKQSGRVSRIKVQCGSGKYVTDILARIAVYIRYRWNESSARSISGMRQETFRRVKEEPWKFLEDNTLLPVRKTHYKGSVGREERFSCIDFVPEPFAIQPRRGGSAILGDTLRYSTGVKIKIEKPPLYPVLPITISGGEADLGDFYPPLQRLKLKIAFYMKDKNYRQMLSEARHDNFEWKNSCIAAGITGSSKAHIHATARARFMSNVNVPQFSNKYIQIIMYCFSANVPEFVSVSSYVTQFQWFNTIMICFNFSEGALKINSQGIMLGEEHITSQDFSPHEINILQFAPGWSVIARPERRIKAPLVPFRALRDEYKAGTIVQVRAFGNYHYMQRDPLAGMKIVGTIQRQILGVKRQQAKTDNRERHEDCYGDEDEPEAGPSDPKRRRLPDPDVLEINYDSDDDEYIDLD